MALVTKEFKLDLAPGQLRPVVNASQGDIGRPFKAYLYWNGSPWTATGYTAKIRGKKPDNTVFDYSATVSGSSVTFSTTEQMTIISGPVECELVFSQGDDVIASANFMLVVEGSPWNPEAPSESVIPGIEDIVADVVDDVIGDDVGDWLDEHPEATTTVQDGAVTTAKLADGAVTDVKVNDKSVLKSSSYYENVTYTKGRQYETDFYAVLVPPKDSENNYIIPKTADDNSTPLVHAQKNGTTLTTNCGIALAKPGGGYVGGNVINGGVAIVSHDVTETIVPNSAGYVGIKQDRTVKDYPITATAASMIADGVYTGFTYYWKLVENGSAVDNSGTTGNETGVVTDARPRLAFGVKSDKTFVVVACDGRTNINRGWTSDETAAVMLSLGCVNAWNMDGGGSTSVSVMGSKLNRNIDDNGTEDRLITTKFDVVKEPQSKNFVDTYAKIGQEKQNIIQQIIPALNDIDLTASGNVIPSNTDLNSLLKPGKYCSPYSGVSATLGNCPVTETGFEMFVYKQGTSGYVNQIIISNDGVPVLSRVLSSGDVGAWRYVSPERIQVYSGSLTASSWGDHYYADMDISSYIPAGCEVMVVMPGPATDGGILQMMLQSETTVRFLNDENFTGASTYFYILIK